CFCDASTLLPCSYALSLHDALPISLEMFGQRRHRMHVVQYAGVRVVPECRHGGVQLVDDVREAAVRVEDHVARPGASPRPREGRSEEHTSELQSHLNLVCRLLLEKK